MDYLLRILLAFIVTVTATGAELRVEQSMPMPMDCGVPVDGTCPCGMPMPGPVSCTTSLPTPMAAPTRPVAPVTECAVAANGPVVEPSPWPAAWIVSPSLGAERHLSPEPIPVDTGPPLLASERSARLRVFRI